MYETYKALNRVAALFEEDETDIVKLTLRYQHSQKPELFAHIFVRHFPLILAESKKYVLMTEDDKAACAIEELHSSLMNFKVDMGAAPITLFMRYFKRRLWAETRMLNHQKRKANNSALRLEFSDEEEETDELGMFVMNADIPYADSELIEVLRTTTVLTQSEIRYCEFYIEESGHMPKPIDIARRIGVSAAAITHIKNSLKTKLPVVFNLGT